MLHCTCCMAKDTVKSRAPMCLDSRHCGCSCVTHHSSFPIPWVLALSEQKNRDQCPMTKVPSPSGWMAYLLFPLIIVVHGISYRSSKVQRRVMVGSFIPAHPLPAYTFFGLIYYFPKYNIQRCWPHLFSDVRDIPLTPNCIPQLPPPQTQSQIPHSKFPIPNRPESTATPMFGTLCGEVIT